MTISENRELMRDWNWARNDALQLYPNKLKSCSNKKVWWMCDSGHEWEMSIYARTIGRKCPYCSRRRVLVGDNDLATTHPQLAEEWDYSINAPLTPRDVTSISSKRVAWICRKCGHEWMTKINSRTGRGTGCDECAKIKRGENRVKTRVEQRGSLAKNRADLLIDWDYDRNTISPESVTEYSNKYVYWKCHECGHQWSAKICNRSNGRSCPCCSRRKVVQGKNDLATTHPELAKEWHPIKNGKLTPQTVSHGMDRKVWWICPHGHSYKATLLHRSKRNGTNCPLCNSGRQTSFREQAFFYYLKQAFPDAISRYKDDWLGRFELDIFIPSQRLAIEYDGIAWHKEEKFEREKRKYLLCCKKGIKLIRIKEKMPENGKTDRIADDIFSVEDIEKDCNFENLLRFVLDELDPRSNPLFRKRIFDLHSPVDINLSRDRFKILQTTFEIKGSAAELYPYLVKEWHPSKNGGHYLSGFKPGSDFKAWWICPDCGLEYEATISHRVTGTGCRRCGVRKSSDSKRKNAANRSGGIRDAKLLEEWNYEKNGERIPKNFAPGSSIKVWWRCRSCGYEWEARISNRSILGRGCPCCANRVVVPGKNDLQTLFPQFAKEWDYERNGILKPTDVVPGYNKRVWWKCLKCGHSYQVSPNSRVSNSSGCRKCADKMNWVIRRKKSVDKEMERGQMIFDL